MIQEQLVCYREVARGSKLNQRETTPKALYEQRIREIEHSSFTPLYGCH